MFTWFRSAKEGVNKEEGWGTSAYNVSKVGVSALTFVHQKLAQNEEPNRNIQVNCLHPGYVDTDMTSHQGPLTIEEGCVAALYLALDANDLYGKYLWRDATVVDWAAPGMPAPY